MSNELCSAEWKTLKHKVLKGKKNHGQAQVHLRCGYGAENGRIY
jgi:hypothetical protein